MIMSTSGGSPASIWINGNVALFVVLVVAAVLLLLTVFTLAIYCCCCRKKVDHWKRERTESKSTNSQAIHVDLHGGDSLDADSAITANVRGASSFEFQIEQRQKQQYAAPQPSYSQPVQEKAIGVEEVRIEYAAKPETPFPLSEIKAQVAVEPPVRMEVTIQASSLMQQQQQRLQQESDVKVRKNQRHGVNIYESGINEITIVDSDFSDYEENAREEEKPKRNVLNSVSKFGWQLLPNSSLQPVVSSAKEEPTIFAIDRNGQEYVPEPPPTVEQLRIERENNLAELDRTLDIFKQHAAEAQGSAQVTVNLDATYVDEELVQPIDRSQAAH